MSNRDFTPASPEDEEEERKNFCAVVAAFKHYRVCSIKRVNKTEAWLNTLPQAHQEMLVLYRENLSHIRHCIDANFRIIKKMIENVDQLFGNYNEPKSIANKDGHERKVRNDEIEAQVDPFKSLKVQITLKQFARDWSTQGTEERRQCYQPIIDEVLQLFNPNEMDISNVKVLIPGAGLGRLTYELAYRGYYCEGNEFSLFMLLASNFVLNQCTTENQYTLYPWVHQFVNNISREDQTADITFPDVSATEAPAKGTFQMVAGDFLQVYTLSDYWDCIATCFFIDCANNVVDFIERIYSILKPGGIWINLGPLLYHYSDIPNELSIEPTFEDLLIIIETVGFQILKSQTNLRTKYAQNPRSMQQSEYLSVFTVCKKPERKDM